MEAEPPSSASRRRMLITPAMASEPYRAEAPSRRTSMRSTATVGMAFRSTAAEPRPIEPLTLTRAEAWRRMPLIRTRVWSGARPRRVAGRTLSVPSVMAGRGKVREGATAASAAAISVVPWRVRASVEMTSTGARVSRRVRPSVRVPVTTSSSTSPVGAAAWAVPARSETADTAANRKAREFMGIFRANDARKSPQLRI